MRYENMKLRYVILDCSQPDWVSNPEARRLFGEVIGFRLRNYAREYGHRPLPVDKTDFFSTHHLICKDTKEGFVPLLAYKATTLADCRAHYHRFPLEEFFEQNKALNHEKTLAAILSSCDRDNSDIVYYGSWTIDYEIRKKDRSLAQTLKEIMKGVHPLSFKEENLGKAVTLAALKFHVDTTFEFWGYKPFAADGVDLPALVIPTYSDAKLMAYEFDGNFSGEAMRSAQQYCDFWQQKIVVTSPSDQELFAIAA